MAVNKKVVTVKKVIESVTNFLNKIICGDALQVLKTLPSESVDCIVTSPPYYAKRDYDVKGQLGLEPNFQEYLEKLLAVFAEVKRVLKPQGTCFVNLGDTYGGSSTAANYIRRTVGKTSILLPIPNPTSTSKKDSKLTTAPTLKHFPAIGHVRGNLNKCLLQITSRFALGMVEQGWILRNEIIWRKPNCMPDSTKDRFTVDYEKLFFFVKKPRYYFNQQFEPLKDKARLKRRAFNPDTPKKYDHADKFLSNMHRDNIEESRKRILKLGRNKRCVWTITNKPFRGPHFATFPTNLVETPIKAGCPKGGIVLDPFMGSGTTALVAQRLGRNFIGIDLNRKYVQMTQRRIVLEMKDVTRKHSFFI